MQWTRMFAQTQIVITSIMNPSRHFSQMSWNSLQAFQRYCIDKNGSHEVKVTFHQWPQFIHEFKRTFVPNLKKIPQCVSEILHSWEWHKRTTQKHSCQKIMTTQWLNVHVVNLQRLFVRCCRVSIQWVHQSCLLMETWLTQTNFYKGNSKTISWKALKTSAEMKVTAGWCDNFMSHYTLVVPSSVIKKYQLVQL